MLILLCTNIIQWHSELATSTVLIMYSTSFNQNNKQCSNHTTKITIRDNSEIYWHDSLIIRCIQPNNSRYKWERNVILQTTCTSWFALQIILRTILHNISGLQNILFSSNILDYHKKYCSITRSTALSQVLLLIGIDHKYCSWSESSWHSNSRSDDNSAGLMKPRAGAGSEGGRRKIIFENNIQGIISPRERERGEFWMLVICQYQRKTANIKDCDNKTITISVRRSRA